MFLVGIHHQAKSYYLAMIFFLFLLFLSKISRHFALKSRYLESDGGSDSENHMGTTCLSLSLKYDNGAILLFSMIKGHLLARVAAASCH